ncbi:hypothetical protein B7755_017090 [Streptomyces sp. NBS 14/10]|uniref:hypothetical protein n=1 Tax=Streptomyces sp. NBS 14/10 TaxID=1945643 RepID=UPI00117E435E|nr:hypothetical protein [Streptomyces sp. NBS 14/10]KAK1179709.1 hypothetical protein B7755_017090 [Streptomyces sp. NBS 14/10]
MTVAAASGCSSSSDEDTAKPAAKVKRLSVKEATTTFEAEVTKFDEDGGCLEQAPGTCWGQMQPVPLEKSSLHVMPHTCTR